MGVPRLINMNTPLDSFETKADLRLRTLTLQSLTQNISSFQERR